MTALTPSPLSLVSLAKDIQPGIASMGLAWLLLISFLFSMRGPDVLMVPDIPPSLLSPVLSDRKNWPGISPMGLACFNLNLIVVRPVRT